ncbi:MAG: hypothetical protein IPL35_13195 [Sphingobacteriales bacterium]|nr:hypothetical protein [Sphingobacteriales bacterium]
MKNINFYIILFLVFTNTTIAQEVSGQYMSGFIQDVVLDEDKNTHLKPVLRIVQVSRNKKNKILLTFPDASKFVVPSSNYLSASIAPSDSNTVYFTLSDSLLFSAAFTDSLRSDVLLSVYRYNASKKSLQAIAEKIILDNSTLHEGNLIKIRTLHEDLIVLLYGTAEQTKRRLIQIKNNTIVIKNL